VTRRFYAFTAALVLSITALSQSPGAQGQTPARTVWDGVYSIEQSRRGERFSRGSCEECHGEELIGSTQTRPLVGTLFTENWNDLTAGEFLQRIQRTMPPAAPGTYTRQSAADVIA
jgi:hypothetical protein